jgi:hypothetical protein
MSIETSDQRRYVIAIASSFLIGLAFSASKLVSLFSFFGFWMGAMWILPITTTVAVWFSARRHHSLRATLLFGTAFVLGLAPGAYTYAASLKAFQSEFLFPLIIGGAVAITLAPLIFRRVITRSSAA